MGSPLSFYEAVAALERGGVVVIPTDTVYGLAARFDRPEAIARIFDLKGRSKDRVLQVLVGGAEWIERIGRPSAGALTLARHYWPGPLTIVVEAGPEAPKAVTSEGTVGLRMPAHPLALEILSASGPLAATSANRSGEATPQDVASIRALFDEGVDSYVDGGRIGETASTVVDTTGDRPMVVREGAITEENITRALGFGFEAG